MLYSTLPAEPSLTRPASKLLRPSMLLLHCQYTANHCAVSQLLLVTIAPHASP